MNGNTIFIFIPYSQILNMGLGVKIEIRWEWRWIIIDVERNEYNASKCEGNHWIHYI